MQLLDTISSSGDHKRPYAHLESVFGLFLMGDSSGVYCVSKFDWVILSQIRCPMGSSACCADQSDLNTLLCGSRDGCVFRCRENLSSAFLSSPCANLISVLHLKPSCYFLHNLSFAFTPCLLLLICWGFCGIIYMCKCEKEDSQNSLVPQICIFSEE